MSRLRWPDSTNSVSDVPGTIQFEYAMLVALVALVSLGAVTASGGSAEDILGDIAKQLGGSKSNCSSTGVGSSKGKCQ